LRTPRILSNDRNVVVSKNLRNAGLTESCPFVKLAPPITNRNPGAAFSVDQLMPKQRRTSSSRPVAKKKPAVHVQPKRKAAARPARPASPARERRGSTKPPTRKPVTKASAKPVARRAPTKIPKAAAPIATPSREQAVEMYERGVRALQLRQYDRAALALRAVLSGFPDEKELQERARVYLSICERQAGGAGVRPRSFEERVNAATVLINRGAFDDGMRMLRDLESENPQSDHVQYLFTVAFTSMGDVDKALTHLRRAVELNPENRFLSTSDADLEPLRRHSSYLATLESPGGQPVPRRRATARRR
jgi:tetratricopeptide (TPR) repeat protein